MTKILGKNIKQLRVIAKEYKIKGRSLMGYDQLRFELWKAVYGEDYIPKNREESVEFLLLHPNKVVQDITSTWTTYGGRMIIDALEVVSRCHASNETNSDSELLKINKSPAFQNMVKASVSAIYSNVSTLSHTLYHIEARYHSETALENWKGDVLYLCGSGFSGSDPSPHKIYFYPSGESRPLGISGWMLLEPGQKELAQELIKQRWKYDQSQDSYWISVGEFQTLREYLNVKKAIAPENQ